ncbi:MAG: S8 family serine peptidase [Synechococcales cyanobacterium K44_A2020_017]|nr:S8 family serine peptidase [Synechococcales cyanobacterium K32_A2020_035]MBF2095703.1 S8 family serine peptidase [Synechococcales cyanobacterium K44_A2020_017]
MAQAHIARRTLWFIGGLATSLIGIPALALITSVGEDGIDARRLHDDPYNITGAKISIGQVEIGRPPMFGLDKTAPENFAVRLSQVFFQDEPASANDYVDGHASNVASVMISTDKSLTGVAPGARLYSAAAGFMPGNGQPLECLASQTVALQNGDDVRAINFSFGESLLRDPRPDARLDGNALLTQCIDWSANVHNVLYVIAGNQGRGGIPIPTDNFNGMNVSNSRQIDGEFIKVDVSNLGSEPEVVIGRLPELESNVGARRSITLVAPGTGIEMFNPDGTTTRSTGTSFAAPHVTAAVALIQEFGDRQLRNQAPNWSLDSRQSEVSKVILLNSADKIEDEGNGLNLGMRRTIIDQRNRNWLESDAYTNPAIPLDAELGTGHLNAFRAYQQFSGGQWKASDPIAAIGWDYDQVGLTNDAPAYRDYVFNTPLAANSYLSVTLAWNRQVTLSDRNGNELFDVDETFIDGGLNNLDLYLMPADATDTSDRIWSSVSAVDSTEHIFYQIPATGRYKLRVVYRNQANEPIQSYALAWWGVPSR